MTLQPKSLAIAALGALSLLQPALAATTEQWRSRSIYQVIVDRYARTDGSTTAACDVEEQIHCGGTWKGLENKLDYIQGMGFTAVSLSHYATSVSEKRLTQTLQPDLDLAHHQRHRGQLALSW